MNYEEKLREIINSKYYHSEDQAVFAKYFPELKENEDERMRKEIINFLRLPHRQFAGKRDHEKWIAWLQKQGEQKKTPCDKCKKEQPSHSCQDITALGRCAVEHAQKSADKIEPKFNVGDWIVTHDSFGKIVRHIDEISDNIIEKRYVASDEYGLIYNISFSNEHKWHKWTIKDAEDGDVLVTPSEMGSESNEQIFLFKAINSRDYVDNCIEFYCGLCDGRFYKNKTGYMGTILDTFYPATKEQRDTLFVKMKEAGYEWDAEKKELKKIEPKILGADNILPYLGNNQVQDILEDMGMLDDNGQCPHTAEEIFKAGMEHAFNLNHEDTSSIKLDADKMIEWLKSLHHARIIDEIINKFKKDFGL